jgi:chromosome segregation ATPase
VCHGNGGNAKCECKGTGWDDHARALVAAFEQVADEENRACEEAVNDTEVVRVGRGYMEADDAQGTLGNAASRGTIADYAKLMSEHVRAIAADWQRLNEALATESVNCDNLTTGAYEWSGQIQELERELENERHRVAVQTSALKHQIENWTKVRNKNFALEAENEALRRERDALRSSLRGAVGELQHLRVRHDVDCGALEEWIESALVLAGEWKLP